MMFRLPVPCGAVLTVAAASMLSVRTSFDGPVPKYAGDILCTVLIRTLAARILARVSSCTEPVPAAARAAHPRGLRRAG